MSAEISAAVPPAAASAARPFEPLDYGLYALTVLAWSASWFAISLQVGVVSPEVNLVWRFSIATVLMFAWVLLSRRPLAFPLSDHLRFAALGILMFSSNFLLFYYGALYLVSGLLSVVFSLASVVNMLLARGRDARAAVAARAGRRTGGLCRHRADVLSGDGRARPVRLDLDRAAALRRRHAVLLHRQFACRPSISGAACRSFRSMRGACSTARLWAGFLALLLGKPFIIEPTLSYFGSLIFLAVVSTVVAFAAYLTLLGRIGAARAGYSTVMFPVFALLISTALEGYAWTPYAIAGLALVAIGNVLVIATGSKAA